MDDRYQPRRPDDRDEPQRRRPDDDDDYPQRRPPPRPGPRTMSVVGLISLIVGVIAFGLSLVPCLNLFTWPLQAIGLILALVGVGISAFGQREGMGLPLTGLVVNVLACAVPVAMYLGFCGLGMHNAQQAAQQAAADEQAEQEALERADAERRETEAVKVAAMVALSGGSQGQLTGAGVLGEVLDSQGTEDGTVLRVGLTSLVNENKAFVGKVVRVQGTIESTGKNDDGVPFLNLVEKKISLRRIHCVFDDLDPDGPDADKLPKRGPVTVEGTCEGRWGPDGIVRLSECRVVK
jgi:hypothetical protein